jgi:hypothetical protein
LGEPGFLMLGNDYGRHIEWSIYLVITGRYLAMKLSAHSVESQHLVIKQV